MLEENNLIQLKILTVLIFLHLKIRQDMAIQESRKEPHIYSVIVIMHVACGKPPED